MNYEAILFDFSMILRIHFSNGLTDKKNGILVFVVLSVDNREIFSQVVKEFNRYHLAPSALRGNLLTI